MIITRTYLSRVSALFLGAMVSISAYGYEVETHARITRAAIARSTLWDTTTLRRLGLYPELDATLILRPDNGVYQSSWSSGAGARADLMLEMAVRKEDDGLRALQHFFDPQNNRGQTVTIPIIGTSKVVGLRSWQWVLSGMDEWTDVPSILGPDENQFTSESAKNYLEQAILATSDETRRRSHGKFLAAIGHVVHHVQDMAQPEHVRNDSHCNVDYYCVPAEILAREDVYDPSEYEPYVLEKGYSVFNQWDYPIPAFNSYKGFWTNPDHAGMADFTNRFALSKDTNFRGFADGTQTHPDYPYPNATNANMIEEASSSTEVFTGTTIEYVQTKIYAGYSDAYLGTPVSHSHLTATDSLFSIDIEEAELLGYNLDPSYTETNYSLDSRVFESAASHLLPRAEAYSAGLINYMLRGRLGVKKPDRGYYALIGFASGAEFTSLKFKLRNETPDIQPHGRPSIPQDVGEGAIVAVASFRPNPCFEDDLSGEIHVDEADMIPSNCGLQTWLDAKDEVRVVSEALPVSEISREWQEYEFDFSNNPIPLSARDLEVYFVFRGDLGAEEEAIIVERKNISEPTYFAWFNSSDHVWTQNGWEDGIALRDTNNFIAAQYSDMSYDYDVGAPFSVGQDRLDISRFHRVVALLDSDNSYILRAESVPEFSWPDTTQYGFTPIRNETREVKDRRTFTFFGIELFGPYRYANQWCDDEGCTLSGLRRIRGVSQWSSVRPFAMTGYTFPPPTEEEWNLLPPINESDMQQVTVNE